MDKKLGFTVALLALLASLSGVAAHCANCGSIAGSVKVAGDRSEYVIPNYAFRLQGENACWIYLDSAFPSNEKMVVLDNHYVSVKDVFRYDEELGQMVREPFVEMTIACKDWNLSFNLFGFESVYGHCICAPSGLHDVPTCQFVFIPNYELLIVKEFFLTEGEYFEEGNIKVFLAGQKIIDENARYCFVNTTDEKIYMINVLGTEDERLLEVTTYDFSGEELSIDVYEGTLISDYVIEKIWRFEAFETVILDEFLVENEYLVLQELRISFTTWRKLLYSHTFLFTPLLKGAFVYVVGEQESYDYDTKKYFHIFSSPKISILAKYEDEDERGEDYETFFGFESSLYLNTLNLHQFKLADKIYFSFNDERLHVINPNPQFSFDYSYDSEEQKLTVKVTHLSGESFTYVFDVFRTVEPATVFVPAVVHYLSPLVVESDKPSPFKVKTLLGEVVESGTLTAGRNLIYLPPGWYVFETPTSKHFVAVSGFMVDLIRSQLPLYIQYTWSEFSLFILSSAALSVGLAVAFRRLFPLIGIPLVLAGVPIYHFITISGLLALI